MQIERISGHGNFMRQLRFLGGCLLWLPIYFVTCNWEMRKMRAIAAMESSFERQVAGRQKLNRHKFSPVSASKLPFSKESGEAAAAAARFDVECGTAQLRFHYEAELSNVVVRVDLRNAQVFELGPVESICVDEGSNGGENEKMHTDVLGKMLDSSVSIQPLVKSIQELASAAKLVEAEIKVRLVIVADKDLMLKYLESALHAFQGQFGAAFCNKLHCYTSSQILPSFMKKQIVYQRSDHRFAIDSWLDFLVMKRLGSTESLGGFISVYPSTETWLSTDCLFAICELLKSTPKIEAFVLRRIEVWKGHSKIYQQDIVDVLDKQLLEGMGVLLTEEEQQKCEESAVHEAGHKLLAHLFPQFDWHAFSQLLPGGKETAISVFYPREDTVDQGYTTFGYLKMQMVVAHRGRCAERIVFGDDFTDGGRDDLEKITKIAREMVISQEIPG
ncbi:hypothetical protein Sjap_008780 [Stephania japonica]|uniref:Peptidase M41 domain-containing protein n=1 Tax=Stephania japonica TaxID=461633 RepID=A0AAP0JQ70_9MAGN